MTRPDDLSEVAALLSMWRDRMVATDRLPVAEVLSELMCIVIDARDESFPIEARRLSKWTNKHQDAAQFALQEQAEAAEQKRLRHAERRAADEAELELRGLLAVEKDRHAKFQAAVVSALIADGYDDSKAIAEAYSSDALLTSTDIDVLGLTERPRNCLKRSQINTVGQLLEKTEDDLLAVTNLGQRSVDEIRKKLAELRHAVALHGAPELEKRETELAEKQRPTRRRREERNRTILTLYRGGTSVVHLADQHHLSKSAIYDILKSEALVVNAGNT
jgi:hypothetical protein